MPRFGAGARLFATFAALSLVPVLGLGALLAEQYRHEVQQRGVEQARAQAGLIARLLSETQLEGHDLRTGLSLDERRRLSAFATSEIRTGHVTRLRLRAPDQRVVFSDDGSGLGGGVQSGSGSGGSGSGGSDRSGEVDEEAAEALEGSSQAEITRLNDDSVDVGPAGAQVVEVYTAVRDSDSQAVIGVLEVYLPYRSISAELDAGLHRLYLALALGLGLLYLLLAGLAGWTTRRLGRDAAKYEHLALHDPLTGLPNRTQFAHRIGVEIAAGQQHGGGAAVVLIDLDRFREINDTLGHHNGDILLSRIAERLARCVRPQDTLARLGGDEFGLVLPGVADSGQIEGVLTQVRAAIEKEVDLGGLPVSVDASLGVVFIPRDGHDPDALLQHADVAMYVAKRTHGGVACYDVAQDHYNAERLALVSELRRAVQQGELRLHYQPQVHQPSGTVRTLEALIRWQHPTRGLLLPDEFVPIAEQTGLIDEVTGWVLDTALASLREWRSATPDLVIAINISARSLQHLQLPGMVLAALERFDAEPDWLLLEITETALVTDATRAAAVLGELSAAGLRLSLDDFGQGYTSLSQLNDLPLSELKIDKSFVLNMLQSPGDAAIVRSVIDLAHNLGMDVVAEGVEQAEAVQGLLDLGCDITQGYWLCRPLPADEVAPWLAAHLARPVASRSATSLSGVRAAAPPPSAPQSVAPQPGGAQPVAPRPVRPQAVGP